MPSQAIVQANHITKSVQSGQTSLKILSGINIEILPASTVAILGVSGSGKTTLLSILAGLDLPSSGDIFINQNNLTELDEDKRAQIRAEYIGFVFQSFHLLPSMTALENVIIPLELKNDKQAKIKAQNLLQRVGLGDRTHHYPRQLSGGEQQRVAIARAFASDPKILFADEPTGNLDQKTGQNIIDLLFELNQEKQTTLVLVTHDQGLSLRCQQQYWLENGVLNQQN